MAVPVDERLARLRQCLPGANCGACGFSGCDGYASALLSDGAETNLCTPGGNDVLLSIGAILGTGPGESIAKLVAIVHCMGDNDTMRVKMDYAGIRTCMAAIELYGGEGACTFGCIGYGDCAGVCPSEAICLISNLARIDAQKCTGCSLCVKTCPNAVIDTETQPVATAVLCKNTEKGAMLKDKCSKGCIACMKCVKECPAGAIAVIDSLARIDYGKCTGCGVCADVCVKGCIIKLNQGVKSSQPSK
jgi:Na+-translocating ferredoxin:NAD+ oxidoreductase RNF subunit RnfB